MDDTVSPPSGLENPFSAAEETPVQALIAADVGGTHARVALVDVAGASPRILALQRYACAEHPSLAAILADFRAGAGMGARGAAVAIAGVLDGDHLINTNLAWPVSVEATRLGAGLTRLALLNDFEAVAHAIAHMPAAALVALNGEQSRLPRWPALVLGPGTGLGAALRPDGASPLVLTSEVGHAALAPANALELRILERLMQRWPHVDNERVFSGPGLLNLYQALCELHVQTPRWQSPAALVAAAAAGEDARAQQTLEVFAGWLGSVCGDLALAFGARSVYLAGGIAGHVEPFLLGSGFRTRFLAKGLLGDVLAQVPVWRVEHGELGVLGAAAWHIGRQRPA